jgi:hypothetical protein
VVRGLFAGRLPVQQSPSNQTEEGMVGNCVTRQPTANSCRT